MKTDKLYYQIFLAQPALLAELIPGLPADCAFEYVAPVVKESEFRLDGLLMPLLKADCVAQCCYSPGGPKPAAHRKTSGRRGLSTDSQFSGSYTNQ